VTFLSPTTNEEHLFWAEYIAFMEAAATDLGIELTVLRANDRYQTLEVATQVLAYPESVDYFVYIYQAKSTVDILARAEKVGVKSVITNTEVVPSERYLAGYPRGRFKQWIGHIYPDDMLASQLLTQRLLAHQGSRNLRASDGLFHVVGIGGSRDTTVSSFREMGLRETLKKSRNGVLDQYVLSNWDNDLAYEKALLLLQKYPQAKVYWAASDGISIRIQKAMRETGIEPGRDAITGGIDWSVQGIESVRSGAMEATVGGHFMEGAWALVMIYDYLHGRDFVTQDTTIQSQMSLIDSESLKTYLPILDRDNWKKIDFKRFTRTHNPNLKEYDFSPDAIVRELAR